MLISLKYILFIINTYKGTKRTYKNVENIIKNLNGDLNYLEISHSKEGCSTYDNSENSVSLLYNQGGTKIAKYGFDLNDNGNIFNTSTEYNNLTHVIENIVDKSSLETKNIKISKKTNVFDHFSITEEQLDISVCEKQEEEKFNQPILHINGTSNATNITNILPKAEVVPQGLTIPTKNHERAYDCSKKSSDFQLNQKEVLKHKNSIFTELKIYIDELMLKLIPASHKKNYSKNIENIEKACEIFDKYKFDFRTHKNIFKIFNDKEFLSELKILNETFDKNANFDQITYDIFLVEFNTTVFYTIKTVEIWEKLRNLSNDHSLIVFYFEFMKLYKYIYDIPELLVLGNLIDEKSMPKIIFIMHLINLFAENIDKNKDKIENHQSFILLIVAKAFDCFYGINFNIFLIPYYELICEKYHHDLTFLLWGHERFRYNVARRINRSKGTVGDLIFLKIIILTFLYQYSTFIKYNSDNVEEIIQLNVYIRKVMNSSSECIACLFTEFFAMFRTFKA